MSKIEYTGVCITGNDSQLPGSFLLKLATAGLVFIPGKLENTINHGLIHLDLRE